MLYILITVSIVVIAGIAMLIQGKNQNTALPIPNSTGFSMIHTTDQGIPVETASIATPEIGDQQQVSDETPLPKSLIDTLPFIADEGTAATAISPSAEQTFFVENATIQPTPEHVNPSATNETTPKPINTPTPKPTTTTGAVNPPGGNELPFIPDSY